LSNGRAGFGSTAPSALNPVYVVRQATETVGAADEHRVDDAEAQPCGAEREGVGAARACRADGARARERTERCDEAIGGGRQRVREHLGVRDAQCRVRVHPREQLLGLEHSAGRTSDDQTDATLARIDARLLQRLGRCVERHRVAA
jgi:hypothetical protein